MNTTSSEKEKLEVVVENGECMLTVHMGFIRPDQIERDENFSKWRKRRK
jgi:hypothetical protein